MRGPWGYPLKGIDETGLYTFLRWLAVPYFGGVYRCRVEGAEHLPRTGPAMVAMTHKCFWDPVIAGMIFEHSIVPIGGHSRNVSSECQTSVEGGGLPSLLS